MKTFFPINKVPFLFTNRIRNLFSWSVCWPLALDLFTYALHLSKKMEINMQGREEKIARTENLKMRTLQLFAFNIFYCHSEFSWKFPFGRANIQKQNSCQNGDIKLIFIPGMMFWIKKKNNHLRGHKTSANIFSLYEISN